MAVGTVSAVPVLAANLLHVLEKEEWTERKIRRGRPDGSWRCIRSPCPRTQPSPRVNERGTYRGKRRKKIPDGSWRYSRSPCPRTQPPPRGRDLDASLARSGSDHAPPSPARKGKSDYFCHFATELLAFHYWFKIGKVNSLYIDK